MAIRNYDKFVLGGVRGIPAKKDILEPVRESVDKHLKMKELGRRITRSIGFDMADNTVVLVKGFPFERIL